MNDFDFENPLKRQGSESGTSSHPAKKQKARPSSLAELSGNDRGFELIHFIQILFTLNAEKAPEELPKTVNAFAKEVKLKKDISPSEKMEHLARLVKNLISKQFSNPVVESLREIITNALDAQVRAGSAENPLLIALKDDTLEISDQGDGMGTGKLSSLLVPGISSNGNALFDSEASIEGNTGRFGQGALSVFHLMMPSDRLYVSQVVPNSLTMSGELQSVDGPLEVSSTVTATSPTEQQFKFQSERMGRKPKISIASYNGDPQADPISFKVSLEKAGIFVDLVKKPFPRSSGTCFKIRSSKLNEKCVREALSYFRFTSRTPIYFNGEWINPPPSDFTIVSVDGARLLFIPELSTDNRYGEIIIAEKGRKILVVPCKGIGISKEIVLDFNDLQPSQDRATVNWRDPGLRNRLEQLIRAVIENSELSVHEKISIFNSLTGLPKIQGFDLTSSIETFLEGIRRQLLPNLRPFRDLVSNSSDYFFIDEKHLKKLDAFEKVQWDNCEIYLVASPSQPAVKVEYKHEVCYLFDKQLFPPAESPQFILMMQMIQHWINAAHLANNPKTFDPSVFVRKFLVDDLKKSPSEVLPQMDSITERPADFPQAATAQEFRDLANKFLQKFPDSIEKTIIEAAIKKMTDPSYVDQITEWAPCCDFLLWEFIDVHLKASPKFTEVVSDRVLERGFLADYIDTVKLIYQDVLDDIDDEQLNPGGNFRVELNRTIELITSHGSGLGSLICMYCIDKNGISCDRVLINAITKLCEKYPIIFDFNDTRVDGTAEYRIDLEHLFGYSPENIEDFLAFFDRFPEGFANCLIDLLFSSDRLGYFTDIDLSDLIRSLNAFDNDFVKFFFQSIEPLIGSYYRFASQAICDKGKSHSEIPRFFIPVDVFEDFRSLIYLSTTLPDHIKKNFSNIFFSAYFIQLGLLKKTDRAQLKKIVQILSGITIPDQMYERIQRDFGAILIVLSQLINSPKEEAVQKFVSETMFSAESKFTAISITLFSLIYNELGSFTTTSFVFPDNLTSQVYPLAEDHDVCAVIGDPLRAKQQIAAALKQNLSGYSFIIKELIRNASDSGCKKIFIETGKDAEGNFYVTLSDDGSGMNEKGFQALKTPNFSTKNKSEHDSSSFGLGFFSVFSMQAFDEVHVSTEDGTGIERNALFIKRHNTEIFYSSEQKSASQIGAQATGTRITLKKECDEESVDIECGIFTLETANIVSEFPKVPVYFNKMLISKNTRDEIAVSSLLYPGEVEGARIVVATSGQRSGIYRENLFIGPVGKNYLHLLPSYIQEYLEEKLIDFKIFLPPVDQVMTRSHVVNSKDVESAIQHGVLWAAIKTIAHNLVDQSESQFVPDDYWYDFRRNNRPMHPTVNRMVIYAVNGIYSQVSPEAMKKLSSQFDNYLKENEDRLILPSLRPERSSKESTMDSYFSLMVAESLQKGFQTTIQRLLNDQHLFTELICHLPLSGRPSAASMKMEVISVLKAHHILADDNDYNLEHPIFLPENKETVPEMLRVAFKELIEKSENPLFKKMLDHFMSKVQWKICNNTAPIEEPDAQFTAYEPLGKFLQIMSRKVLQKEITYKFIHARQDRLAHTHRGTNCIHINVDIEPFQSLPETIKSIRLDSYTLSKKIESFEKIAKALSILSHEVTHMEETMETLFTHDKQFYSKMCSIYERFMIRLAQDESLVTDSINEAFLEA